MLVDKSGSGVQGSHIRQAVNAAAGTDAARGHQVTVQAVAFDTSTQKQVAKEMADSSRNELIGTIAKNAGAVILLVGFLLMLRSIVTSIKVQAPIRRAEGHDEELSAAPQASSVSRVEHAAAQVAQADQGSRSDLPPEVSESNPEDLARLVRSWMADK